MKNLGYSCERARYAVKNCLGSGFCVTGCIYGAKQSLLLNYLPQAVEAGATVATELAAVSIRPCHRTVREGAVDRVPHRYEVQCKASGENAEDTLFRAKLVILAGGTVGTAKLLLHSQEALSSLSPQVGRNIAFNGGVKLAGLIPPHFPDGDMFSGRSHAGMISYEFLKTYGVMIAAGKPLPVQAVAARLRLDGDGRDGPYWGTPNVDLMKQYRRRMIVLAAFGLTPPSGVLSKRGPGDSTCSSS